MFLFSLIFLFTDICTLLILKLDMQNQNKMYMEICVNIGGRLSQDDRPPVTIINNNCNKYNMHINIINFFKLILLLKIRTIKNLF